MNRKWWWALPGLLFLVILCVAAIPKQSPLDKEEGALRSAGFPSTWPEIVALAPQNGIDAAAIYQRYSEKISQLAASNSAAARALDDLTSAPNAHGVTARDKDVLLMRPYLADLIRGSKADRWSLIGATPGYKELGEAGNGPYLLCYLAIADAHQGLFADAMAELDAADRMAQQICANPNIFSSRSAMRMRIFVMRSLNRVMQAGSYSPAVLEEGAAFLSARPGPSGLRNALEAECVKFLLDSKAEPTIEEWKGTKNPSAFDKAADRFYFGPRVRRYESLEVECRIEALSSLPANDNYWEDFEHAYESAYRAHATDSSFREFPSSITLFRTLLDIWGEYEAFRRVEMAALRIQMIRLSTGSLPSALPASGTDAIDPFTHKLLKYRKDASGFVVYSVGKDRTDDGGPRPLTGVTAPDDVAAY